MVGFSELLSAAQSLYQHIETVKTNQTQCERLKEQVSLVLQHLESNDALQKNEAHHLHLKVLKQVITDAVALTSKFQEEQYYKRFLFAATWKDELVSLHQRLTDCIQSFKHPEIPLSKAILPWSLPGYNPHFVGRTKALDTLAHQLQQGQHTVIGQSVSGLGGIGKTQLALAFAHRHKPRDRRTQQDDYHHYQAVLWLNAANLEQETINLAEALRINPQEYQGTALYTKIYHTLAQLGESILLVFDNAPDQASLADWADGFGVYRDNNQQTSATLTTFHLLVTSRSQHWKIWQPLPLSVFTPDEACDFVLKRLPNENPEAAQTLVKLVYHLPLALAQAVAYVHANDETITSYCRLYRQSAEDQRYLLEEKLEKGSIQGDYFQEDAQRAVYLTWYLSIKELQKDCPLAVTVLNLVAFLAPRGIPTGLFSDAAGHQGLLSLNKRTWNKVKSELQRYSLVTYHPEVTAIDKKTQPPRLDIHQLLQEVIRLQLQQQTITEKKAESHLEGLPPQPEPITEPHHQNPTTPTHCYDRYGAYVLAKIAPLFRYDMANASSLQLANSLYAHNEQIASLAEKAGWDKPLTARLWGILGRYQLEAVGNAHAGRDCQERALAIFETCYGQDHVEVARTRNDLAAAYYALGKMQQAKEQWERALPLLEKHCRSESPDVAKATDNLAMVYGALDDPTTQKTILEHVLAFSEDYYGKNHVKVAGTLNNLANAYGALGDHQNQKTMLERALAILESYYGQDHVEVAKTLNNLAMAYGALGDHQTKKTLLERALRIQEAYHGKNHVVVTRTQVSLANAYGALGDHQTQKTMLERALAINEVYYGQDHVEVANTQANLAVAFAELGELDSAYRLIEAAYHCYANHPDYSLTHPHAQQIAKIREWITQLRGNATADQQATPPPTTTSPNLPTDKLDAHITRLQSQLPGAKRPAEIHQQLGRYHLVKRQTAAANHHFQQALNTDASASQQAYFAYFLYHTACFEAAQDHCLRILAIPPSQRLSAFVSYNVAQEKPIFDDGLKAYATNQNDVTLPVTDWAYYLLVQSYLAMNQYTQAQQTLNTWRAHSDTFSLALGLWYTCRTQLQPYQALVGQPQTNSPEQTTSSNLPPKTDNPHPTKATPTPSDLTQPPPAWPKRPSTLPNRRKLTTGQGGGSMRQLSTKAWQGAGPQSVRVGGRPFVVATHHSRFFPTVAAATIGALMIHWQKPSP